MGVEYNDKTVKMSGIISENEITPLREHLTSVAPEEITFDLDECDDIHTAVLQLINAYNGNYGCQYQGDRSKAFIKYLDSFVICES